MKQKSTTAKVYVFKVALKGAKRIWRRIAIRSDQTLDELHQATFDAFDRYDEHLYSFYLPPLESRTLARHLLQHGTKDDFGIHAIFPLSPHRKCQAR